MQLRRVLALCIAAAIIAPASSALAQQRNNQQQQQQKFSKAEQADILALSNAVDFAAIGQVANDVPLTWEMNHFMKSADSSAAMAYAMTVDRAALGANQMALYIRLMDKAQLDMLAAAAAAATADSKEKKDDKTATLPTYAVQQIFFLDTPADGRLTRIMGVPAGEYEAFFAVKEKAKDEKSKTPAKIGVLRKTIVVPDYTTGLTTSDVIVAKQIEETQPLPANKVAENPYTFGPIKITPTIDPKFSQGQELGVMFWIYNAGLNATTGKPDVEVEYNFHQKSAEGEKFFNKTAPVAKNATTLPAEFDFAKGHQLTELQSVPLKSFPPGDYRLEIKVTDKTNNMTVTRNVNFNVSAS